MRKFGEVLASKVFDARSPPRGQRNVEVHLTERELASLLQDAYDTGVRRAKAVAEAERHDNDRPGGDE